MATRSTPSILAAGQTVYSTRYDFGACCVVSHAVGSGRSLDDPRYTEPHAADAVTITGTDKTTGQPWSYVARRGEISESEVGA